MEDDPSCYRKDMWGYSVHTQSDDCISFINRFYRQVLMYGADRRIIIKAANSDRSCVLACALAAGYLLTQQEVNAHVYLTAAKHNRDRATRYERLILAVVSAWAEGQIEEVLDLHFQLVAQYPKDLVSLKRGQTLCFYMGRQEDMLNLALQALTANHDSPFIHGMLAFALVEVGGRMREAEMAARQGLAIDDHDLWAQHALCHVLQYECRFGEAITFMSEHSHTWSNCCSFLYTHNWWHVAVCHLEQGGTNALDKVLAIYDAHVWDSNCQGDHQDCLNALGLLLRLDVRGHHSCVDARLTSMHDLLLDEASWHKEWLQDLLIVWGLSRGHNVREAGRLLQTLTLKVQELEMEQQMVLECILRLAKALYEYGTSNYKAVCQLLGPVSNCSKFKVMGASDEQLDVIEELWCIAHLRAGQPLSVAQVAERRVLERSKVPFSWRILEEAYSAAGETEKTDHAAVTALGLETAATATTS
ncbi:unnamed protein product [Sphagnum troendelagicum]|uniref:Tetratricopeptide repeat protein 38 n=1 Tax=Sphagnum troendelagicum TaxID=128251 RepID=A0ABP0TWB6_9BRYO